MKSSVKKRSKKSSTKRKSSSKKGDDLLNEVVTLTGLPPHLLKNELKTILDKKNINIHHLSLGDLRSAAASYLREIMGSLLDRTTQKNTEPTH